MNMPRCGRILVTLTVAACACLAAWAAPDAAYLQRLARAERLVAQAERDPQRAAALLQDASALLPASAAPSVQHPGGKLSQATFERAHREIEALRRTATLSPPRVGTDQARPALTRVLQRGEFQALQRAHWPKWKHHQYQQNWLQKFSAAISKVFQRFFKWLGGVLNFPQPKHKAPAPGWLGKLGVGTRYVIYAILGIIVLLALGVLLNKLLIAWQRRKAHADCGEDDQPQVGTRRRKPEATPWDRALQQIEALWQRGDTREAMRLLQRTCLQLLDARGILRYDETRANGEVLRELRRQGRTQMHAALRPVMASFDRSWYGYLDLSAEEFRDAVASSQQLRAAVQEEAA